MDSLKKINYLDYRIEYLSNYINELDKYGMDCDKDIQKERIEIYKSIKEDLEVLEIIYNKHVSVGRIKFYIPVAHDDYSLLKNYNDFVHAKSDELTLVELKKIKQWLLSKKSR